MSEFLRRIVCSGSLQKVYFWLRNSDIKTGLVENLCVTIITNSSSKIGHRKLENKNQKDLDDS